MAGSYILGTTDLSNYGIIPAQDSNTNIAISGCWDMPQRIGKTHHDWGDEDGVQPYVRADEIRLGGRDIVFNCLMQADYENEVLRKLNNLYNAISNYVTLVPFNTPYGSFSVYLKEEVQADYIHQGWAKLRFQFREPVVSNTGVIPSTDNANFGIDGISFQQLGLTILEVDGRHNLPSSKTGQFTAYQTEGYQVTKKNYRELTLKAIVSGSSLSDFENKCKALFKLFSKEGIREITYRHDALRQFFCKDGFQITQVRVLDNEVWGLFTMRCVQLGQNLNWDFLTTNSGEPILTATGAYIYVDNSQSNRDYNYLTDHNSNFLTTSNNMKIRANDI